jgi:hypothetical protein
MLLGLQQTLATCGLLLPSLSNLALRCTNAVVNILTRYSQRWMRCHSPDWPAVRPEHRGVSVAGDVQHAHHAVLCAHSDAQTLRRDATGCDGRLVLRLRQFGIQFAKSNGSLMYASAAHTRCMLLVSKLTLHSSTAAH